MKKLVTLGLVAALVPLAAFAFAPKAPPGPAAIEEMLRGLFKAVDSGDREAVKAAIAKDAKEPVLCWDNDLEGKPVAIKGVEATHKYLDGLMDAITKSSAKMTSKIGDLHAACDSPALGYATFSLTQSMMSAEGKSESATYWVTALVTADKNDKWHIFHWHSSPAAEAPSGTAK
ncbi:MAG TPA: nuclear transport factor 2 family protein [Planctomycetota bacterium]|nr:nuclear transport factor 2 family protein [Planctomycetota bacterium]